MGEDLELAADAFFVDEGPELGEQVGGEAEVGAGGAAVGEHGGVALGLHGCEVVLLFDLADFGGDVHALGEQIDELVVDLVDVLAVLLEELCVGRFGGGVVAQVGEEVAQLGGSELLAGVGEGALRVGVRFDDEAVEAHLDGLVGHCFHQVGAAGDVAGVADDGQGGDLAAEFEGD